MKTPAEIAEKTKAIAEWHQAREAAKRAEELAKPRVTYYTSAPEAYDGFGTLTLAIVGRDTRNREPVRKVSTPTEHYDWQTMRYGSGLQRFTTERCTLEGYTKFGDWVLTETTD